MSEMKHTPGPWLVEDYTQDPRKPEFYVVPATYYGTVAKASSEDDARLIATAPDMHSAGTELLDLLDNWMVVTSMTANERYAAAVDALRAAILKAEGSQP